MCVSWFHEIFLSVWKIVVYFVHNVKMNSVISLLKDCWKLQNYTNYDFFEKIPWNQQIYIYSVNFRIFGGSSSIAVQFHGIFPNHLRKHISILISRNFSDFFLLFGIINGKYMGIEKIAQKLLQLVTFWRKTLLNGHILTENLTN